MQALVKRECGPGLWLEEVPVPAIAEFDVLIRILRTSICGTDVHIYEWDSWAQRTVPVPMQIGHEFVGIIESVGNHVIDFHQGMIVTGEGHIVCGRCRNCLAGRRHLCNKTNAVGVNRAGAFAEYLSIPQTNVWVADPKIPLDVLSCFDPLGNAVHTALSFDVLGEDVLVTGAGPIGIMAAAIAKYAGARFVVITDLNPYRLKLAAKLGVTRAVDARKLSLKEVMDDLGMKEGFDVGLEMSGNSDALNSMLTAMCHGGKIAVLGIQSKSAAIDWDLVVFNGLTIKGIYGREMYETWYKMTTMIQSGLDISPVITHWFPYREFEEGFQLMKSGQSGKIILHWSEP
ncbi:MAG: L-threonine 3-dehydrogenase [Verrucomicrobia bacterium]|nr:L-threonine 3-dehydrogenase [Verrucomicrobiota bacterium]MBV9130312.1 L-threonine 3-dehydrogenase [Verrucomicrobiota bacterium]MBV9643971.1 L-threonine 3-dehydrogenase [Verrucomicrobiota bacterium]